MRETWAGSQGRGGTRPGKAGASKKAELPGSAPQFGDDPERLLAAGDALDVVEGVAERLLPVLPARPRHMRRQDDVLQGEELVLGCGRLLDHDIKPGPADPLGDQRVI